MAESDETPPEGETPSNEDTAEEKLPYDPNRIYTWAEAQKIGRVGVPLGRREGPLFSEEGRQRIAEVIAIENLSRLSIAADTTIIGGDGCACGSRHRRKKHKG